MFSLVTTASFDRRLSRFRRLHPDLRGRLARLLKDLEADPLQPHLRLQGLQGELAGLYAVRPTRSYRVVLAIRAQEREIVLLDIGTHDQVYG